MPPTPEQMFELAGACFELGKTEGSSLTRHGRFGNAKFFNSDFLPGPQPTYLDYIIGDYMSVSRKFLGKIALATGKAWQMHIKEIGQVFRDDSIVDQVHINHQFEWSGGEVHRAVKRFHLGISEEDIVADYLPEILDEDIFQADLVTAEQQIRAVTAADCANLMENIHSFRQALQSSA